MTAAPAPIGILGGSGFYALPGVQDIEERIVDTPFGAPSAPLMFGTLAGRRVVFLPRHGRAHDTLPSHINVRANIYALKAQGVRHLIAISAVGSLSEAIAPGHMVAVDQFLDQTRGRPNTFFGEGLVAHVSMAEPTCPHVRHTLVQAARAHMTVHTKGTYVCIEGPQFSTRAESNLWRAWGAHVVGMTALPEARLAREAELCYALIALPTDYDAWSDTHVTAEAVAAGLAAARKSLWEWLPTALEKLDLAIDCECQRSLDSALLTPLATADSRAVAHLQVLLARRAALSKF